MGKLMTRKQENLRKHPPSLGNQLVGAIGMLEVHCRSPVNRLVLGNCAGSAIRRRNILIGS